MLKAYAWKVFRNGPSNFGYVGKSNATICAELTKVEAMHWDGATSTCGDLIERHFEAYWCVLEFMIAMGIMGLAMIRTVDVLQKITETCVLEIFYRYHKKNGGLERSPQ